jgi:hypothetical protein
VPERETRKSPVRIGRTPGAGRRSADRSRHFLPHAASELRAARGIAPPARLAQRLQPSARRSHPCPAIHCLCSTPLRQRQCRRQCQRAAPRPVSRGRRRAALPTAWQRSRLRTGRLPMPPVGQARPPLLPTPRGPHTRAVRTAAVRSPRQIHTTPRQVRATPTWLLTAAIKPLRADSLQLRLRPDQWICSRQASLASGRVPPGRRSLPARHPPVIRPLCQVLRRTPAARSRQEPPGPKSALPPTIRPDQRTHRVRSCPSSIQTNPARRPSHHRRSRRSRQPPRRPPRRRRNARHRSQRHALRRSPAASRRQRRPVRRPVRRPARPRTALPVLRRSQPAHWSPPRIPVRLQGRATATEATALPRLHRPPRRRVLRPPRPRAPMHRPTRRKSRRSCKAALLPPPARRPRR